MRPKGSAKELEQRRRMAVGLLEEGLKPAQVAKAVGVSRASVTRWRQMHRQRGDSGLPSKPHPGRPPRLRRDQRERLMELLKQAPRRHGYQTELWTLRRVAEVIAKQWDVTYHPGHVWYLLRELSLTAQKPERRARERDEQAIARWRTEDWPRIKKRAKKRPPHPSDR